MAVKQVAASVTAALVYDKPIVTLPEGARLPVECRAFDHNAFEISSPLTVVRPSRGGVNGRTCDGLFVNRSGLDTLNVTVDTASEKLPITIAVQANISSLLGDYVNVDSFPAGASPWSPTVWRRGVLWR